jgi:hypothetical protein
MMTRGEIITGEYECFHQCQKRRLLESWLSMMSTLEEVQEMGVFREVSKVVSLWHRFKHGPHGKML